MIRSISGVLLGLCFLCSWCCAQNCPRLVTVAQINAEPSFLSGLSRLALPVNSMSSTSRVAVTPEMASLGAAGSAPTDLSAMAIADSQIDLSWTASTSSGVTYSLFRSTADGFAPSTENQIASGLTNTIFSDTGLTASSSYFYVVEGVDSFGASAASNQASATTLGAGRCSGSVSSITANFNGTAMLSGDALWFSSVAKVSGIGPTAVTIFVRQANISFVANGATFQITVPDANLTFDPNATIATTTFNTTLNLWQTVVPASGLAGNVFLDGAELMLPNGLPGGIKNVIWSAAFSSDTPGISLNWQWAAATYTSLGATGGGCTNNGPNLNELEVKPVDDNKASEFKNSDHAGTPEGYKSFVTGGATGGGGSNFTGSYSGTRSDRPTVVSSCGTTPPSCS